MNNNGVLLVEFILREKTENGTKTNLLRTGNEKEGN
jgi:hypothetical protein